VVCLFVVGLLESTVSDVVNHTWQVMMTDLNGKFVYMNNQRIFRTSALRGVLIGVSVTFVVILASTRSFLMAVASTACILASLISVSACFMSLDPCTACNRCVH
jgi:hypothetical protein